MYRIRPLNTLGTDSSALTRASLLKAAAPLFAEHGFEATRTRDIADKAKSNVSAINYHFGSKMGLYQAVIKEQSEQSIANYPLQSDELKDAPAEERFRFMVRNLLRRVLVDAGPKSVSGRMCVREFAEPTEALDFLVTEVVQEQFDITRQVIRDVIGHDIPADELDRFAVGIGAQCFHYRLAHPLLQRLEVGIPEYETEIDKLSDHIAHFSLAGLRAFYPCNAPKA